MKQNIRIGYLIVLLFFCCKIYAQNYKGNLIKYVCHYGHAYKDRYESTLKIVNNISEYKLYIERKEIPLPEISESAKTTITEKKYEYYYFLDSKQNIWNRELLENHGGIKVFSSWKSEDNEWEITNETKKILGYTVIKAIKKYKQEDKNFQGLDVAWFAPDIPLSTGPEYFNGLPGLILQYELEGGDIMYKCTAKKISEINMPKIKVEKKGMEISKYYNRTWMDITEDYLSEQEEKMVKKDKNYKRQLKSWWQFW